MKENMIYSIILTILLIFVFFWALQFHKQGEYEYYTNLNANKNKKKKKKNKETVNSLLDNLNNTAKSVVNLISQGQKNFQKNINKMTVNAVKFATI